MTDYLADVVMPPPAPPSSPEPPAPPESVPPTDTIIEEQMNIEESEALYEVEEEEEEEIIPEPERRRKIPQEEIFSTPKVKTILDPESMKDPVEDIPPPPKERKQKQTRKKRGPASAEQLERLARGREKAKETRARKKLEKEEKLKKDKSDKELVEAVRDRERKKLRKKLETPIDDEETIVPKVQIVEKPVVVEKGYSQKDLDDAVARAVEQSVNRVEVLRKQRKDVKKKAQAKAEHDAKVFKEINTAMKNDVWANCFV